MFDYKKTLWRLFEGAVLLGFAFGIHKVFPDVVDPVTNTRASVIMLWCGVGVFARHGVKGTKELIKSRRNSQAEDEKILDGD